MVDHVIFHIGWRKSGTTSLQHWLSQNREMLRSEYNITYPMAASNINRHADYTPHHKLANQLNPAKTNGSELESIARACLSEASGIHNASRLGHGYDAILFSSEDFPEIVDMSRVRQFVQALGAKHVQVICYIREHLDYAVSNWKFLIKHNSWITFSKYIHDSDFLLNTQNNSNRVFEFLERWESIGDLYLDWYDRTTLKRGNIIDDFCAKIGIEDKVDSKIEENPSLGGNLLVFRAAEKLIAATGRQAQAFDVCPKGSAEKLQLLTENNLLCGLNQLENMVFRILEKPWSRERKKILSDPSQLEYLAKNHKRFNAAFFISDAAANYVRINSNFNRELFQRLEPPHFLNWESKTQLPDKENLDNDLEKICSSLGFRPSTSLVKLCRESEFIFKLDG